MKSKIAILVLLSFAWLSCATIFKGTSQEVSFGSNPVGAQVWIDGKLLGKTPAAFKLESKKTYSIEFRAEGYQPKTVTLNHHVGAGWIILDVLSGLVPVIIDAATGSWYSFDQNTVNVDFK